MAQRQRTKPRTRGRPAPVRESGRGKWSGRGEGAYRGGKPTAMLTACFHNGLYASQAEPYLSEQSGGVSGRRLLIRWVSTGMLPIFHQALGAFLVLSGLIVLPLPIPFGLLMITIGCALLAPYVPAVQRVVRRLRRKSPRLNATLLRHRHRFPPVIRNTIDKTHPEQAF